MVPESIPVRRSVRHKECRRRFSPLSRQGERADLCLEEPGVMNLLPPDFPSRRETWQRFRVSTSERRPASGISLLTTIWPRAKPTLGFGRCGRTLSTRGSASPNYLGYLNVFSAFCLRVLLAVRPGAVERSERLDIVIKEGTAISLDLESRRICAGILPVRPYFVVRWAIIQPRVLSRQRRTQS